jgi:AbrB family looped-hinge helix DNA binding protein
MEKSIKASEGRYAWTVKVGSKGQFVIPKEARDVFAIKPGDTLIILADAKQGMIIPPPGLVQAISEKVFGGEKK